jgi:hypothetical protein
MPGDLHNNVTFKRAISPVSVGDNTAQVSQIIDRKDYESVEFAVITGSLADADATFTALLEESDDSGMAGAAAVTAAPGLIGALPSFLFSDDDKVFACGYAGSKRYVRLTITPASNASAALMCAVAILVRGKYAGKQPGPGSYPTTEGTPLSN